MRDGRDIDEPPADVEDDPTKAVEEAEPYFPPTDPVIEPGPRPKVVGGFEADAMTGDASRPPSATTGGSADEGIADSVRRELRQDAATAGLDLDVSVEDATVTLRGVVQDLADVDNALAVAGRVAGVSDVIDELEVAAT
jgi:hypothetical protein